MKPQTRVRIAIATNALGKAAAGHHIYRKLEAARKHGFEGVEVAFECLEGHADSAQFSQEGSRADRLRAAARDVIAKASAQKLEIIALNPFMAYDSLEAEGDISSRLEEAELWCQLCQILRAPIFQVRSAS